MNYESRIEHLKLHANRWDAFLNGIERSVNHEFNNINIHYDDPRMENDLKLSNGITIYEEKNQLEISKFLKN